MSLPTKHPSLKYGKTGILLVNLGTPDSLETSAIRRYLREFLSDRRVVDVNPILWQLILNGPILTFRPRKIAKVYEQVWMKETDESPLRYFTRMQSDKLAERLNSDHVIVDWAMRYGNPSMQSRIDALTADGCERIILVPLYPHYSAATTATVCDKAFDIFKKMRRQPGLRTITRWDDHPQYIQALADSLKTHLDGLDYTPDKIIISYHGIPKHYFEAGDPYHCYCQKTSRLLREATGFDEDMLMTCFQSRFGPRQWLQPYLDETLKSLPEQGVKKVVVMAPGFTSDCIETLEEIAIAGKEEFVEAGGEHFSYVPCLNDSDAHIDLLETLVKENGQGWL